MRPSFGTFLSTHFQREGRIRSWLPYGIGVFAIGCLIAMSTLYFSESPDQFPRLAPGRYQGSITGDFSGSLQSSAGLYVAREEGQDNVLWVVLRTGWQSQSIRMVSRGVAPTQRDWVLPLMVAGKDGQVQFVGHRSGEGQYEGEVIDLQTGERGKWDLHSVESPAQLPSESVKRLKQWLALQVELSEVYRQEGRMTKFLREGNHKIEELNSFIGEGETLRLRADKELSVEQSRLQQTLSELKNLKEEVASLKKQYDIAQRLTPKGRLVSLARETLDREDRWREAVLAAVEPEGNPEAEALRNRGELAVRLQQEISEERKKLSPSQLHDEPSSNSEMEE